MFELNISPYENYLDCCSRHQTTETESKYTAYYVASDSYSLWDFYRPMPEYTPNYFVSDFYSWWDFDSLMPEYTPYYLVSDFYSWWVFTALCQRTHPTMSEVTPIVGGFLHPYARVHTLLCRK